MICPTFAIGRDALAEAMTDAVDPAPVISVLDEALDDQAIGQLMRDFRAATGSATARSVLEAQPGKETAPPRDNHAVGSENGIRFACHVEARLTRPRKWGNERPRERRSRHGHDVPAPATERRAGGRRKPCGAFDGAAHGRQGSHVIEGAPAGLVTTACSSRPS
jgi:hypothetical protein